MATFNAEEKRRLLDAADNMNIFMAKYGPQIDDHEKFVNGNGHAGAKSRLDSIQSRIAMIFIIMGTAAGIGVKVFTDISSDLAKLAIKIASTPHP
jgi:hypothetical protein